MYILILISQTCHLRESSIWLADVVRVTVNVRAVEIHHDNAVVIFLKQRVTFEKQVW